MRLFIKAALTSTCIVSNCILCSMTEAEPKKTAAIGNPQSLEFNEQGVAAAKRNSYPEAEDLFRKALSVDSKNLTAAFNLSGMYLQNKKEAAAVDLLESYVKSFPTDAGVLVRLGDAYFVSKRTKDSLTAYERAEKLDPHYPGLYSKLATSYLLQNNTIKAEELLLKAVKIDPKNGLLLANLASIFLGNKKPQESISTAKRALQLAPSKEVYLTLGNAYEILKDPKNALIAFERARDLGDKNPELSTRIEELKNL